MKKLLKLLVILVFFYTVPTCANPDTDLRIAVEMGDLDAVKKAIESGANPNTTDEKGETPLFRATYRVWSPSAHGHLDWDMVEIARKGDQESSNAVKMCDLLLESGWDPNIRNAEGNTPIHKCIAAKPRFTQFQIECLLKIFLKHGFDANKRNLDGMTIFCVYAYHTNIYAIPEWMNKILEIIGEHSKLKIELSALSALRRYPTPKIIDDTLARFSATYN